MVPPLCQVLDQLEHEHAELAARLDAFSGEVFDAARGAASLRELLIAVGMHFGLEESLMEDGGYALFDHHRRQHLGIMTELGLLLDRVESGEDPVGAARSADLLARWYREHVTHGDRPLLDWLASRG